MPLAYSLRLAVFSWLLVVVCPVSKLIVIIKWSLIENICTCSFVINSFVSVQSNLDYPDSVGLG